jgi:hypothetical protein
VIGQIPTGQRVVARIEIDGAMGAAVRCYCPMVFDPRICAPINKNGRFSLSVDGAFIDDGVVRALLLCDPGEITVDAPLGADPHPEVVH